MTDSKTQYTEAFPTLERLAQGIEAHIRSLLHGEPRIDRISARAKAIGSFVTKAETVLPDGSRKYEEPLRQVQDQVGARIVTFYRQDVERIDEIIKRYFRLIEHKDRIPESEWEFGYFGRHFVLAIPSDVISTDMNRDLLPRFFELQIKTLFQHAWSEAGHDLGYKPGDIPLSSKQKRHLAFASAQAWGADNVFEDLYNDRLAGEVEGSSTTA